MATFLKLCKGVPSLSLEPSLAGLASKEEAAYKQCIMLRTRERLSRRICNGSEAFSIKATTVAEGAEDYFGTSP